MAADVAAFMAGGGDMDLLSSLSLPPSLSLDNEHEERGELDPAVKELFMTELKSAMIDVDMLDVSVRSCSSQCPLLSPGWWW